MKCISCNNEAQKYDVQCEECIDFNEGLDALVKFREIKEEELRKKRIDGYDYLLP